MINIVSYKKTREIIEENNFVFKKNFGQNFLIDSHVLSKIIDQSFVTKNDVVIEIGPGIGSLTEELLKLAYKVIAIEIDKNLIPILKQNLSHFDNLEIINEDVLKVDLSKIFDLYNDKNIKIVANLPYYITTPIIMSLLENYPKIKSITVMVQKEVANRLNAKPGTKDYGAITLAVGYYATSYLVANVPRNCFFPRPNVDSCVIRLDIITDKKKCSDVNLLFKLIKIAFSQRRKTFLNCLFAGGTNLSKEELANIIEEVGFDKNIRGEVLSLDDFIKFVEIFKK